MADQLRSARVTGATLGSELPARISELETAISVITGIPLDVLINNPMTEVVAAGLRRVILQDLAADPASGQIARSGSTFRANNSLTVGSVPLVIDKSNAVATVGNTLAQTAVYSRVIEPNLLGLTGRLRLTAWGRVNIRALHTLTIASDYAGVGNLVILPLVGGVTTDRTLLALRVILEISMNGAINSQRAFMESHVTQAAVGTDAPAWGAPGAGNVGLNLADISTDMSPARTLRLYVQWSQADPADSVSFYQFLLELLN